MANVVCSSHLLVEIYNTPHLVVQLQVQLLLPNQLPSIQIKGLQVYGMLSHSYGRNNLKLLSSIICALFGITACDLWSRRRRDTLVVTLLATLQGNCGLIVAD